MAPVPPIRPDAAMRAPAEIRSAIRQASDATGVPFDYLASQAEQESGFRADARAATGSAAGLYQFIETTWLRMMRDHGLIGRRYAGKVKQIISGSIGFDDWEWGVDLFADDPLVFKQLIYEMRFDEASAWYALFGPFYLGIRVAANELATWLEGRPPRYGPPTAE